MAAVYGSLFKREPLYHNWEPVIAADYDLSSDGKNYTIYLDTNAKFSDGSPVLAEDIKYTYELHMTPLVSSSEYSYLSSHFESNNSIEVVNSHTLNFNLTSSFAFSKNLFSLGIIDKSDVERTRCFGKILWTIYVGKLYYN
jgi:peptide/nickel transport system substrate-binding protein